MNSTPNHWQPTASLSNLKKRAQVLRQIRQFFEARHVLEVETPLLSAHTVTDPALQSFSTHYYDATGQLNETLYLQTSPEFAMKRLLAAGSGPIYQITHAFRNYGEQGRWHNPEFTLLEWYRPGFSLQDLMDETESLLQTLLQCPPAKRVTYTQVFEQFVQLNPHQANLAQLKAAALKVGMTLQSTNTPIYKDDWLQQLLDKLISHHFDATQPIFIYDFPVSQAALARVCSKPTPVAERVEVYLGGVELANGFHELTDAKEQRQRFEQDLITRQKQNLDRLSLDERLLAALDKGLPDCAGIALGIDRLVALLTDADSLSEVLTFPIDRA
jgi:elongation factor P--(R)-beta-lysine ligase